MTEQQEVQAALARIKDLESWWWSHDLKQAVAVVRAVTEEQASAIELLRAELDAAKRVNMLTAVEEAIPLLETAMVKLRHIMDRAKRAHVPEWQSAWDSIRAAHEILHGDQP